jgi:amphi-Trp domain-containing protein
MVERVLFESEQDASRSEVADYLRTVADRLEDGDAISLEGSGDPVTLDPPATVEFEVKAEHEGPTDAGELSLELELEWDADATDGSDSLQIS